MKTKTFCHKIEKSFLADVHFVAVDLFLFRVRILSYHSEGRSLLTGSHNQTTSLFYGLFYDTGPVLAKRAPQDDINEVSVSEHVILIELTPHSFA